MTLIRFFVALGLTVMISSAYADTQATEISRVHAALAKDIPGLSADKVRVSPIPGVYEVEFSNGTGYATADGKYLIRGDLFEVKTRTNLTDERRKEERARVLAAADVSKMIVFSPKNAKHTITVFTDVECGYCRKLHSEMAALNEQGIEVRYAAFPRSGPKSEAWTAMERVWCAQDPRDAITRAKRGEKIDATVQITEECKATIADQYALGGKLGLRGTPLIALPDGTTIDGYLPASQLAARLAQLDSRTAAAGE